MASSDVWVKVGVWTIDDDGGTLKKAARKLSKSQDLLKLITNYLYNFTPNFFKIHFNIIL
jgi:hypothetical protein